MPNNNIPHLRLRHLNVRGLESHIDEIKLLLHRAEYHFFAVTETKLKPSSPVGPVRLPAYNFVKHSLPSTRGRGSKACGGIGLYVLKGLKAIPVLRSEHNLDAPLDQRFEYLAVQVKINDLSIGIVIVYNPNVSNPHFAPKKRYGERHFAHDLPAKKLWSNLRREGVHNNTKKNVSFDQADPNEMNRFFCEGHQRVINDREEEEEPEHRTATDRGGANFNFRRTTANEISRKIMEIQTNAAGSDGIPISFIKMLAPFVLPVLVHLYNAIIEARTFPAIWKSALITPIPKVGSPTEPKDFRPISVLPAVSKVLEKILLDQIVDHVDRNGNSLLATNQSGYRKGHSTTTALAKVTHDIYDHFDNDQCTVMVLVDFSLAFNCVNHRKLQRKLREEFHFSNNACDLIHSFLEHRTQAIYISGSIRDVDQLISTINSDLETIQHWARQNSLFPNPKKTQAIIFCKEGAVVPTTSIVFCGERINLAGNVVNLGIRMDCNLKWNGHINDVTAKVFGTLRTLRRFAPVLSVLTKLKLVRAVILPFLRTVMSSTIPDYLRRFVINLIAASRHQFASFIASDVEKPPLP
ncbi:uncharacterized protein LOC134286287 [Aedes albopictus]|uniref:Reverse transcriptase domain-containing protein n=1 Tax=Aedes albopictus TaxID=7160 RepID=A0ABM1YUH0_AEDAL